MLFIGWTKFVLPTLFSSQLYVQRPTPSDSCFSSSESFQSLLHCLSQYTVPADYYNQHSYAEAQPNDMQREAWFNTIHTFLSTDNNCSSVIVPPTLKDIYGVSTFTDVEGPSYCVLYEHRVSTSTHRYAKGWGIMFVPLSGKAVRRYLHLSAPHLFYELDTHKQVAHLFQRTGAKSLFIPGRMRRAYLSPSHCIPPSPSSKTIYYETDPAHNDLEPFFDANRAIWEWQTSNGRSCDSSTCAFIQFHGKANTSCSGDDIFLSAGLGNHTWYIDTKDRPIKRLKQELALAFTASPNTEPRVTVSLPSDSRCSLIATKNVVGRFLNNQPFNPSLDVCSQNSDPSMTKGFFVHIEQSARTRSPASDKAWTLALQNAFIEVDTSADNVAE